VVTTSKDLKIRYTADTSGVAKGVKDIERMNATLGSKLKSAGAAMTGVGKTATLGLTLPLVAFGKTAIDSFGEASRVAAQTDAVLKSTGGAAGVTAAEIDRLSQRVGNLAAVDNDVVQQGANMLLTFTNIRNEAGKGNDVFNQSLVTLQDMASAMGTDTKSSAIQLGKALNDPVAGISALSRVGVTFTEEQKKQIAAMVKAGDTAGAQKVILAELNKEFGGSAKAAGDSATPIQKLGLIMDDLGESVGAVLVPMLEGLSDVAGRVADWFNRLSPEAKDLAVKIALVAAAAGPVLIIVGKLTTAIGAIINVASKIGLLANPWFLVAAAVAAVVFLIIKHWDKIKGYVMPIVDAIKRFAIAAWEAIAGAAETVWKAVSGAVKTAWSVIGPIVKIYLAAWKLAIRVVWEVAKAAWKLISGAVKIAWNVIRAIAKAYVAYLKLVFTVVKTIAIAAWKVISGAVKIAWNVIRTIAGAIKAVFTTVWNAVRTVAVNVWQGIKTAVGNVWSWLRGVASTIRSVFSDVWNGIKTVAINAWNGIKSSITGAINGVIGGLNFLIDQINKIQIHIHVDPPGPGSINFDWNGMNLPSIQPLAKGGIVTGPTLALIGEAGPEAVVPLRAMPNSRDKLDVTLNLDRRRFGRGLELETLTRGR
jgi:phage-related protein